MNTWVTVRKGPRFTHKSNKNPYYIELSNTYSILAELSTNPIQKKQPTSIDSYFILKENITLQEKINNTVNKNITNTRNNDATIINADIELADDERNVMNKTTINHRAQVWKAYIKATHKRNNSYTRDCKHVQFKRKPSIATYEQHENMPM